MLSLASHARLDLLPDHGVEIDQLRAQLWGLLSTLYSPGGAWSVGVRAATRFRTCCTCIRWATTA